MVTNDNQNLGGETLRTLPTAVVTAGKAVLADKIATKITELQGQVDDLNVQYRANEEAFRNVMTLRRELGQLIPRKSGMVETLQAMHAELVADMEAENVQTTTPDVVSEPGAGSNTEPQPNP